MLYNIYNQIVKVIKRIINYIRDKITLKNIKKEYNIIKINIQCDYDECVFCLEELNKLTNNYKCKFCSIIFHEKCFLTYIQKLNNKKKCIQCNQ